MCKEACLVFAKRDVSRPWRSAPLGLTRQPSASAPFSLALNAGSSGPISNFHNLNLWKSTQLCPKSPAK